MRADMNCSKEIIIQYFNREGGGNAEWMTRWTAYQMDIRSSSL